MSAICQSCGAPLEGRVSQSGLVDCKFCGHAHDVQRIANDARRTLISAADFSVSPVGGWHNGPRLVGRPIGGLPACDGVIRRRGCWGTGASVAARQQYQ